MSSQTVVMKYELNTIVKMEVESESECDRAVLYQDHEFKEELAFGPVQLQEQDIARPTQNMLRQDEVAEIYPCKLEPPDEIKEEPGDFYDRLRDAPRKVEVKNCSEKVERVSHNDMENDSPQTSYCTQDSNMCESRPIHTVQKPQCNFCYKAFSKQSDLTRHIRIHTGEKPYSCDVCQKRFPDKSGLSRHIKIHANEAQHSCDTCDKVFIQKSDYDKHVLKHSGDKPHSCSQCGKTFSRPSDLVRHVRVHTREKPYSCNMCDKQFTERSTLTRHQVMHSGVKSYSCTECPKRFIQKSHLNRHTLIHTGEKRFVCDLCGKRFIQKESLIGHFRQHSGMKPYACHLCKKRYVMESSLKKHLNVYRNGKPTCRVPEIEGTGGTVTNEKKILENDSILGL